MPWAHLVIGLLGFAILAAWYAGKKAGYEEGFKDGRGLPKNCTRNPEIGA